MKIDAEIIIKGPKASGVSRFNFLATMRSIPTIDPITQLKKISCTIPTGPKRSPKIPNSLISPPPRPI